MKRTVLIAATALATLAVSCGGGDEGGGATTDGGGDGGAATDTLVMVDNAFEPASWTTSPGSKTLSNEGAALHNLTIEEAGIDEDVQPGQSTTFDLDLEPGEYEMVCEYHVAQGMTGTVTIE
ncbi:MAG TPA: cupredoxin domain-containing protein [Actinomycetota bacterium]|nr:cupredoxin domain-containing protein [Actinomycetota bacterium]